MLQFQTMFAMFYSNIMKPTSYLHCRIGEILFGIAQRVFDDTASFHARQGMLHTDSDAGQLAIVALLSTG